MGILNRLTNEDIEGINLCHPFQTTKRGARWPRGQCPRRVIAEATQRSQWSVIEWVTKIYYRELLHASEGTLSRWSRLHL
jgi:hypothetical protein